MSTNDIEFFNFFYILSSCEDLSIPSLLTYAHADPINFSRIPDHLTGIFSR